MSVPLVNGLLSKALSWGEAGDWRAAIPIAEEAIAAEPENPVCLTVLGRTLMELSRFQEAEHFLRKALAIDSEISLVWGELGLLMEKSKRMEKAAFCFEQAVKRRPDFNLFTVLAHVQLAFDPEAALSSAKRALQLRPDWEEAKQVMWAAEAILEGG